MAFFTPNFAGHLDFQALNDIDTISPVPFPRSVVTSNVSVVQGKGIIIIIKYYKHAVQDVYTLRSSAQVYH